MVAVSVKGPFGNSFRIEREQASAVAFETIVGHTGSGDIVALRRAKHLVEPGKLSSVVNFYRMVMKFPVQVFEVECGATCATVTFGVSGHTQSLVFLEDEMAPPFDAYDRGEGAIYHIAIYCDSDEHFEGIFTRAERLGLVFINKRFLGGPPQFGSAASLEEARSCGQFRIKDLKDPSTQICGLVLEHEIRSPSHVCCPISSRNARSGALAANPLSRAEI